MTPQRPERKPVQMSLFEQRTLAVSVVARRLDCSRDTVLRMLQSGMLKGYRLTLIGWWRVLESSVVEHEEKLKQINALGPAQEGSKSCQ
jgi:excisionase family DNA binding protein